MPPLTQAQQSFGTGGVGAQRVDARFAPPGNFTPGASPFSLTGGGTATPISSSGYPSAPQSFSGISGMGPYSSQQLVDMRARGQMPQQAPSPTLSIADSSGQAGGASMSPFAASQAAAAQPGFFGGAGVAGYHPNEIGMPSAGQEPWRRQPPAGAPGLPPQGGGPPGVGTGQMPTPPGAGASYDAAGNPIRPPAPPGYEAVPRAAPPPMAKPMQMGAPGMQPPPGPPPGPPPQPPVPGQPGTAESQQKKAAAAPPAPVSASTDPTTGAVTTTQQGGASTTTPGAKPSTFNAQDQSTWYDASGQPTWRNADIKEDPRTQAQQFLKPIPANWDHLTAAEQRAWKQDNYNPYASTHGYLSQAPDQLAIDAFNRLYGGNFPGAHLGLPGSVGKLPTGEIPGNATLAQLSDPSSPYYIEDPAIRAVLDQMQNQSENLMQINGQQGGYGSEQWKQTQGNYQAGQDILSNLYGITYDPFKAAQSQGVPGDTTELNDNTTVATKFPSFDVTVGNLQRAIGGNMDNAPLLEFARQQWLSEQGMQRQQQAINIMSPVVDQMSAANNPLRAGAERLSQNALDNPNPVDYESIRNRMSSDFGAANEQATQGLAGAAARGGLPASAVAAIQARMTGGAGNDLARALGESKERQQTAQRGAEYDAITNAANVSRAYQGAEYQARQGLSNLVFGAPDAAANPFAGITDYRLAREAINNAPQGADPNTALIGAGIGAAGTVLGSFIGAPWLGGAGAAAYQGTQAPKG